MKDRGLKNGEKLNAVTGFVMDKGSSKVQCFSIKHDIVEEKCLRKNIGLSCISSKQAFFLDKAHLYQAP